MIIQEIILAVQKEGTNGTGARIVCPACSGGGRSERCMYVDVRAGLYICYRASCGVRGSIRRSIRAVESAKYPRKVNVIDSSINNAVLREMPEEFRERFSWPLRTAGNRAAFEVHDHDGTIRGHVLRSYSGVYPKTINEIDPEYCRLHFPRRSIGCRDVITLVEDIPSAEALSWYVPAAAMCGSDLNSAQVNYLDRCSIHVVHLALDNDASAKSISTSRKYLLDIRPVLLDKDPKDMTDQELEKLARRMQ